MTEASAPSGGEVDPARAAFFEKLARFHACLSPEEQDLLDEMLVREADVQPYIPPWGDIRWRRPFSGATQRHQLINDCYTIRSIPRVTPLYNATKGEVICYRQPGGSGAGVTPMVAGP